MANYRLPEFIFLTGAPGSKWSGIAQILEQHPSIDTSDRSPDREYRHSEYSGHLGAYFGPDMEFEACLDPEYIKGAWKTPEAGSKIVKSHHWSYMLEDITHRFPRDWIMLVWRNDVTCRRWWHQAGGFNIRYPSYKWYENDTKMAREIALQNHAIQTFAERQNLHWSNFDQEWVSQHFGFEPTMKDRYPDIGVTVWRAD